MQANADGVGRQRTVAEHFDDAKHQRRSVAQGVWLFLASEVMLLGAGIAAYAVYRHAYPASFALGSAELEETMGAVNTGVLLVSSVTMALAVDADRRARERRLAALLSITAGLGLAFLTIKGFEYHHAVSHGFWPGPRFEIAEGDADRARLFFGFYFVLTGLHALHLVVAIGLIAWLLILHRRKPAPVASVGLYWHLVDIVWIYLFPMLYLVREPAS